MPTAAERAETAAQRAAAAAGIEIREVQEIPDLVEVRGVFDRIWNADPTNPAATVELLRAYAHTGQYVVTAVDILDPARPVIAASMGFLCAPIGRALHSNVTGVLPAGRGRSLGFALKVHQRAWAMRHGLDLVSWTFDPLIRRNAWFNLAKLGARASGYLPDFYGQMRDAVNAGDASDRLYLTWPVYDETVAAACEGRSASIDVEPLLADGTPVLLDVDPDGRTPRPHAQSSGRSGSQSSSAGLALAQVPPDIESVRTEDRDLARRWRFALREVLAGTLTTGGRIEGIGRDGWYVVRRGAESEEVEP